MTDEDIMLEESNKPFITIDDVQVFVEDLPEEGQQIFGRLQRLNQKKANLVLDLEELQAGIGFFSNRVVAIYNDVDSQTEEPQPDLDTEES
jgi:acyl-CoA hydrolase|tara:strand:- start:198 stop:470 length:273 start_codon:yes stop_codon:yes gene_type:complete